MNSQQSALEDYVETALIATVTSNVHVLNDDFFDNAPKMFYYASICYYAFNVYYAQNYASRIRQGLYTVEPLNIGIPSD